MSTPINNVSDTSIWVATYRATETLRSDALFQDPLAAKLVGTRGPEIVRRIRKSYAVQWSVIIRTVIIDKFIYQAVKEGVDTVLNLGAGLDTRPYRMDLPPDLKWIEVDFPNIIDHKEARLTDDKPRCKLERVKLDLGDIRKRKEFFEKINLESKKVLVITEGVIPYLSADEAASLAKSLKEENHFFLWIVDYVSPYLTKYLMKKSMQEDLKNAPFKFQTENWEQFYSALGWGLREMQYLGEVASSVNRPFELPWYHKILSKFASAERVKSFERLSGYAILERRT